MIDDALTNPERMQALRMHGLAVSVVLEKGLPIQFGALPMMQYRRGGLAIHYLPRAGHLSVWYGRKVLTINPRRGELRVTRYLPGEWEGELEDAANG